MTPQDTARAPSAAGLAFGREAEERYSCGFAGPAFVDALARLFDAHSAEAIRRAEAAEKDLRVQAVEINCAAEGIRQLKAEKEAAEKERDELREALDRCAARLVEEGLLHRQRLQAYYDARAESERLAVRNITVTEETYQRARALLSPPPAPQPEEPKWPKWTTAGELRRRWEPAPPGLCAALDAAVDAFSAVGEEAAPQPEEPEDLWFHRCHNCKTEYVGPEHGPRRCTTCGASTWVTSRQCQGCLDRGWVHTADQKCLLPQATASAAPSAPAPPTKTEEPT